MIQQISLTNSGSVTLLQDSVRTMIPADDWIALGEHAPPNMTDIRNAWLADDGRCIQVSEAGNQDLIDDPVLIAWLNDVNDRRSSILSAYADYQASLVTEEEPA